MVLVDEDVYLDPERRRRRMEWEINRARNERRRPIGENGASTDFSPIVFPECEGLCHAAYVVAGRMADDPDPIEATRTILDALGIPTIMREGGDGRALRVQRGPVRFGAEPNEPADPEAKPKRRARKKKDA